MGWPVVVTAGMEAHGRLAISLAAICRCTHLTEPYAALNLDVLGSLERMASHVKISRSDSSLQFSWASCGQPFLGALLSGRRTSECDRLVASGLSCSSTLSVCVAPDTCVAGMSAVITGSVVCVLFSHCSEGERAFAKRPRIGAAGFPPLPPLR